MMRWILVAFGVGILLGALAMKMLAPATVQAQVRGPYQVSSGGSMWVVNTTDGRVAKCDEKGCVWVGTLPN